MLLSCQARIHASFIIVSSLATSSQVGVKEVLTSFRLSSTGWRWWVVMVHRHHRTDDAIICVTQYLSKTFCCKRDDVPATSACALCRLKYFYISLNDQNVLFESMSNLFYRWYFLTIQNSLRASQRWPEHQHWHKSTSCKHARSLWSWVRSRQQKLASILAQMHPFGFVRRFDPIWVWFHEKR